MPFGVHMPKGNVKGVCTSTLDCLGERDASISVCFNSLHMAAVSGKGAKTIPCQVSSVQHGRCKDSLSLASTLGNSVMLEYEEAT